MIGEGGDMAKARIDAGKWTRRVPSAWWHDNGFRADIFKSVLARPELLEAQYELEGGPVVIIPAGELRRILDDATLRYDEKIFTIEVDFHTGTVNGHAARMTLV